MKSTPRASPRPKSIDVGRDSAFAGPSMPGAETRIESLAAGGAGVGRIGGAAIFVAGAAPGDLVEVQVDRRSRPARGELIRVVEPGPDRIVPPCPFVAACGACDWMHLRPEAQQAAHEEIVRHCIARATGLRDLPAIRVHPAPSLLGYRTRARLLAKAEQRKVRLGYRSPGTHALAAVDRCAVLCDALAPLLEDLPHVLRGAAGEGDIGLSLGAGGLAVVEIGWRGELSPATWKLLDERCASGAWAGARVTLPGASHPASFGDPRPVIQGADGLPLVLAPGGFAQPSEDGASLLAQRAAALAGLAGGGAWKRPPRVIELFAGSGTLSILLAQGAASFIAVERSPEAVACLRRNLSERGLSGRAIAADAETYPIPASVDLIVLDPPRGGAPGASTAIAASAARAVVYVSCDPATLARDLSRLLEGGFEIAEIELIELFPQTSHVETVVRLNRARSRRPPAVR
jgi:23S rRNA (uracil1939-C5)-methyltransferase